MMKKVMIIAVAAALALVVGLSAAAQSDTRVFTDSLGREFTLPEKIERIAVTGPMAQIVVFALAPDRLVGVYGEWDDASKPYIADEYVQLPVLGQLYGGKTEVNLENLLLADPQVVIDVGEPKGNVAADLDALSEQTGIPYVHVSAYTDSMEKTYAMLGELLGMQDRAKLLGDYCSEVYRRTTAFAAEVEKVDLLYVTGEKGLNVIARDSYHSEVIDMLGNNLAVVESPSARGTGNEVDMEQMLIWDPQVIIFSDSSIFDTVAQEPVWKEMTAIRTGAYYEVPVGPYNWMGFPPSVQRLLGMMWMGSLLYPDAADYDLYEEVTAYFSLFYHCSLTREQYNELTANSIGRLNMAE